MRAARLVGMPSPAGAETRTRGLDATYRGPALFHSLVAMTGGASPCGSSYKEPATDAVRTHYAQKRSSRALLYHTGVGATLDDWLSPIKANLAALYVATQLLGPRQEHVTLCRATSKQEHIAVFNLI
jgi:hypothetical protein